MLYLDDAATVVGCFFGWKEQVEVLESTRVGLFGRIYRTVAGQRYFVMSKLFQEVVDQLLQTKPKLIGP